MYFRVFVRGVWRLRAVPEILTFLYRTLQPLTPALGASSSATLPVSCALLLWAPLHGWGIGCCAALTGAAKSAGGTWPHAL